MAYSPQSRVECLLVNLLGGAYEITPQSRVEKLLKNLDGASYSVDAQSRVEKLLDNINGASHDVEPPQSRIEKILHYALGEDVTVEPAQSRVESLLLELAEIWRGALPASYQEVEYIQSAGGAYISIPYKLKGISEMDLKLEYTGTGSNSIGIMGNTNAGTGSLANPKYIFTSSSTSNVIGYYYCSSYKGFSPSFELNEDGAARIQTKIENGKFMIYVNGTANTQTAPEAVDVECPQDTTIFGCGSRITPQRVWWCRFYENGATVVDLVPCYRIADGVIGMYDRVSRSFLVNSGNGSFTKGGDV